MDVYDRLRKIENDVNSLERRLISGGGGGGEANTGGNLGAGVGVYDGKVGVQLQFRSLVGGTGIDVTLDAVNDEIDIDLNANLDDLADVNVPAPGAGNFLQWNGAAWVDAAGGGAPTNAQYVVLALDASLTQERVLTAGTNITITDGGAGGNVTVKVDDAGWTTWAIVRTEGTTDLVADSSVFSCITSGYVGINEATPLAWLHVRDSDTGGARADPDVVLLLERNDDTFLQFLADNNDDAGFFFGDNGDPDEGRLYYGVGLHYFYFYTNALYAGGIDSSQHWLMASTAGLADCKLHVMESNASASSHADAVVCIERNANTILQFLTNASYHAGIYFGDPSDNDIGQIVYDHATDSMSIVVNTSTMVQINSTGVGIGRSATYSLDVYRSGANAVGFFERASGAQNYINATATHGNFGTANSYPLRLVTNATWRLSIDTSGYVTLNTLPKAGATQAAAGAAAGELWRTSSHATLPDNVLMIGV